MTKLAGLSHIALIVRNPARTATLFEGLFGSNAIHRHDRDGHDEVYVHIAGIWLVLVAAEVERPLTGDHIAFHAGPDELQAIAAKLKQMGHNYQMARADTALYFQDFDNHVFEIESAGLEAELESELPCV